MPPWPAPRTSLPASPTSRAWNITGRCCRARCSRASTLRASFLPRYSRGDSSFPGPDFLADLIFRRAKYISPSDNIMSPCTAKLNALRNKQVGKYVALPATFASWSLLFSPWFLEELTEIVPKLAGSSQSRSSPRPQLRNWTAIASSAISPLVCRKQTNGRLTANGHNRTVYLPSSRGPVFLSFG